MPLPSRAAAAALAVAALLAACGDDDPAEPSGSSTSASASPTSATPAPGPYSTTEPPAAADDEPSASPASPAGPDDPLVPKPPLETAPTASGLPTCRSAALTLADADAVVTPDYVHAVYVLRTTGPDCSLQGHPTVVFQRGDGSTVAVQVSQGGFGLPEEPATPVSLSRGSSVSFRVGTPRSGGCVETARIVAELPGTGGPLAADTYLTVCGGRAGVTPVHRSGGDH